MQELAPLLLALLTLEVLIVLDAVELQDQRAPRDNSRPARQEVSRGSEMGVRWETVRGERRNTPPNYALQDTGLARRLGPHHDDLREIEELLSDGAESE